MMVEKTLFLAGRILRVRIGNWGAANGFQLGAWTLKAGNIHTASVYTKGAEEANRKVGFPPLPEFPDFKQ